MDPIDLLEQRIAALELKILPKNDISNVDATQTVTDMLLQVNTLISSALSCREVVTTMLNRMNELNDYLDPNFFDNRLDAAVKKEFILAIYPEVKKYGESIHTLKKLIPVFSSDSMGNALNLVPKLQQLTIESLKMQDECQMVTQNIGEALEKYNDIIYSITKTFVQLEEIITQMECDLGAVA